MGFFQTFFLSEDGKAFAQRENRGKKTEAVLMRENRFCCDMIQY